MTKEEARDYIIRHFNPDYPKGKTEWETAINMAIDALNADGDCIYRQAAINALADYIHNVDKVMGTGHLTADDCKDAAASVFEELPSAQPERKKGKWDERSVFDAEDSDIAQMQSAKCSACGKYHTTPYLYFFDNFNYCPNCGARMEKDDET